MKPSEKIESMGMTLPPVAAPVGAYVPAVRYGNIVVTSGQLPVVDGKLTCTGKVGADVTIERAAEAASAAVMNALAAAAQAAGGIDAIGQIIRVGAFVNSAPGFTDQAKVANGASDLLSEIFSQAGKHARAAVGVSELPLNASVEIELMVHL